MKKIALLLSLITLLMSLLIGCRSNNTQTSKVDNGNTNLASDTKREPQKDLSTEQGEYVGQIDNNSIEVKIEGVPKAFRLGSSLVESFSSLKLDKGDKVKLYFWLNEYNQPVIEKIEK